MKIALVSFLADINDEEKINASYADIYNSLNENFEVTEIDAEEAPYHDFSVYDLTLNFIKSGGCENKFADVFEYLPQPIYLYAVGINNSLPAALEILSFVKTKGVSAEILHGEMEKITAEIKKLAKYKKVRNSITDARIGIIGKPSDWLIGSKVEYEHAAHHWGTKFIEIEMKEFYNIYEEVDLKKAEEKADEIAENAVNMVENSYQELVEAAKIYFVLKEIVDKYNLNALTLRCFDIVEELKTTGCLALALLNNEGIIAGCEGDVPAVFTMYLAYTLTGEIPFMANPSAVDSKKDDIIFAHCTIATAAVDRFILRSHFETGIGVGIQGVAAEGPVTVFKIAGAGLEEYFAAEGRIIENLDNSAACRTQLKVNLPGGAEYFLKDTLANHHILIKGNHTDIINEFLGME